MINERGISYITIISFVAFFLTMGFVIQHFFDPIGYYLQLKDAKRVHDLQTMQQAFETYYRYQGRYPAGSTNYQIIGFGGKPLNWGDNWIPYLNHLPADPGSNKTYAYVAGSDMQSFEVYASLDNPLLFAKTCKEYTCVRAPAGVCGITDAINCNYGVSSSNISP